MEQHNKKSAPIAGGTTTGAEGGNRRGGLSQSLSQSIAQETGGVNGRDLFRRCREAVTAEDAARVYGLRIDRKGKAVCPFHDDHRPSMTFHNGRFRCWACGASGNAIDLTAHLLGVDALSAVRRLDADFHLCLPLDRPLSAQERAQAARREQLEDTRRRYEEWREKTLRDLCAAYRAGHDALKAGRELSDAEALAVKWMAALEWWAETLGNAELPEQMEVFRDREGVERICQAILNNMNNLPMKSTA